MDTKMRAGTWSGWRDLARWAGIALVVIVAATAVALLDFDAGLHAAGFLIALLLLRFRDGFLGLLALGAAFANTAFWSITGAAVNLANAREFFGTALVSVLSVVAVVGLAGVAGALLKWRASARPAAIAAVVLVVAAMVGSFVAASGAKTSARPGDIKLVAERVKFSSTHLESGRRVAINFENRDFFWHTFTVRELDVNLKVPTRGERRFVFTAPSGTYEFVCIIPGHTQAGMKGTLVVR